ncbi:MAG: DNA-processing protein DprA [Lachnospiraceae bacterium]|nr:DNA-processing protein DprA [Lachnospiraceae bacterium]
MDIPDRPAILYEMGEAVRRCTYVNRWIGMESLNEKILSGNYVNRNLAILSEANEQTVENYVNKQHEEKGGDKWNTEECYVNNCENKDMTADSEPHPTVAVIGSRICSEYGRMVAGRIGKLCAQMGIELISGMAVGIDGIAQRAALEAGGRVTAVLGSGVDVCYPKENRELYETLLQKGRIISEYIPGTEPVAGNFPMRNRIISGLADAVIVVEAKERSGTMITVDMALEQGRQVYIIPGRLTDPLSAGCNRLISQGAEIIWNLGETLDMIRGSVLCKQNENIGEGELCKLKEEENSKSNESLSIAPPGLSYKQKTIWEALDFEPRTCQEVYERLMERSDIPYSAMQQELLEMELCGFIGQEGGRFFRKGV